MNIIVLAGAFLPHTVLHDWVREECSLAAATAREALQAVS